ncbi:MAG: N-carbamoylputrescine amidase [Rhodobacteraceae bacterium HLUCCA12]|nr:MAG: N-carbamoylputrescine amidase [Rhodobacteraceae bacterium HLUCCA12]
MFALYQGKARPGDPGHNLSVIEWAAAASAAAGARLLVVPELFVSGYRLDDEVMATAEPIDGACVAKLRKIAARHSVALVAGLPERAGTQLFNTAVAIDARGHVAGAYRKIHLFGPDETRIFAPGTDPCVVEVEGVRIGLAICYDIEFPEMARALVRGGAEMICVPTANMHPYVSVPTTLVRARALENGVPVIYANHCGTCGPLSFTGGSCIVAFDGTDHLRAGAGDDATLLTCEGRRLFANSENDPLRSTQLADLRL